MSTPKKRKNANPPPMDLFVPGKKQKMFQTEDKNPTIEYSPGTITLIQLSNFMIHSEFKWSPGPQINLITGRNGSGKSSILQAIVLGMGEKAQITKRATTLKEFIHTDAAKAEITIHLCNKGSSNSEKKSYCPDKYGDTIIFHRLIRREGNSTFTISGSADTNFEKTGSAAAEERARIIDFFSLDLGNPTVILQQEEAKSFFRNNDPRSLYNFFEKGSLLVNVRESMEQNKAEIISFKETLKRDETDLDERRKEIKKLEGNQTALQNHEKFKSRVSGKQQWSLTLRKYKPEMEEAEKKFTRVLNELELLQKTLEAKEEILSEKTPLRDNAKIKVANLKDELKSKEVEQNKIKSQCENEEKILKGLHTDIDEIKTKINMNQKTIQNMKEEQHNKTSNRQNNIGYTVEELTAQLDELKQEKQELHDKIKDFGNDREDINSEINQCIVTSNDLKAQERNKKHEKQSLQSKEKEANQENNELVKYGKAMVDLCSEIERNISQFKVPPIGPLGKYIKLTRNTGKNENLASLLQHIIGFKLLRAFLVDNRNDRIKLENLMKKVNFGKMPTIETKKSEGKRYDVSKFRIPPTPDCTLMLDHLEFEDDDVFNLVIDRAKPEGILVTNDLRVQELFQDEKRVPRNTNFAITDSWYRYMPPTKGCYSSYYIKKPNVVNTYLIRRENMSQQFRSRQLEIDEEIREIKSKQNEIENKKAQLEMKRAGIIEKITDYNVNYGSYNQKITKIMNLKDKAKAANRTIEEYEKMQAEIQAEIENCKAEKDQKLQEIHHRKQNLENIRKLHEKMKSNSVQSEMQKITDIFLDQEKLIGIMEKTIDGHRKDIREKEKIRENFLKEFHEKKQIFLEQEKEALRLSNGLRLTEKDISLTPREFKEMEIQKQKDDEEVRKKYGSNSQVEHELNEKLKDFQEKKENYATNEVVYKMMNKSFVKRSTAIKKVKSTTIREIRRIFHQQSGDTGLSGHMDFSEGALDIKVKPRSDSEYVPLSSLSGGEKSKTLACLIRAFWQFQCNPFRGLDEWDVFLDDRSRKDVEEMLVEGAKKFTGKQFFFISPQNSAYNNPDKRKLNGDKVMIVNVEKSGDGIENNRGDK